MPDFFEQPVLNSPYEEPQRYWELEPNGQPTQRILETRKVMAETILLLWGMLKISTDRKNRFIL